MDKDAMTGEVEQELAQLCAAQDIDELITDVLSRVWVLLEESKTASGLRELNLGVVGINAPKELRNSQYFTDNCKALLHENLIMVSEPFLLETEAVVRAFGQSGGIMGLPYLKSDDDISALVARISPNPKRYLKRARRQANRGTADGRSDINDTLMMVVLFFVSHEIGHLLDQKTGSSFTSFLDPKASLETCLANAVLKMCRHVEEFDAHYFGLPGFEKKGQHGLSVKKTIEKIKSRYETIYANSTEWFNNEVTADETATSIIVEFLDTIAQRDEALASRYQYLMIRGVFAIALYSWHKDLLGFCRKIGVEHLESEAGLSNAMMIEPRYYVSAASLFGKDHRFTFLRAVLLMESLIRARSDFFDRPEKDRSIWFERGTGLNVKPTNDESLGEWRLSESLLRYYLLCIHMDTPVKLANVCSIMGWVKQVDTKREQPQLRIIMFESIALSVDKLRKLA